MKNELDVEDAWTNIIRSMFERRININAQIDDTTGVRVFTCPNSIKRLSRPCENIRSLGTKERGSHVNRKSVVAGRIS